MKTKLVFPLLLLLPIFGLNAQSTYSIYLNSGYTFNTSILINEEEVENSNGLIINAGILQRLLSWKNISTEIGLGTKTIFTGGKVNGIQFDARTLRFAIPIKLKITTPNKKWGLASAFVFQNNVDISRIDFKLRDKYSWRYDLLFELQRRLKKRLYFTAGFNLNLGDIPDAFLINDPKYSIVLGVIRPISLSRSKK